MSYSISRYNPFLIASSKNCASPKLILLLSIIHGCIHIFDKLFSLHLPHLKIASTATTCLLLFIAWGTFRAFTPTTRIENIETEQKWDMIKFLQFNVDNCDPLNSFTYTFIKDLPEEGTRIIRRSTHRPDTLSYILYGSTQYWWLIMLYNNIMEVLYE